MTFNPLQPWSIALEPSSEIAMSFDVPLIKAESTNTLIYDIANYVTKPLQNADAIEHFDSGDYIGGFGEIAKVNIQRIIHAPLSIAADITGGALQGVAEGTSDIIGGVAEGTLSGLFKGSGGIIIVGLAIFAFMMMKDK